MRIITNCEGGEVEMDVALVDSAGIPLREYFVTGSDDYYTKQYGGQTTYEQLHDSRAYDDSCWVPAVEGQTFEIRWFGRGPESYNKMDIRVTPYLDGSEANCGILFASERAQGQWGWLDGQQVGVDMVRPFTFGRAEFAEELGPYGDPFTIRIILEWGWSQPQNDFDYSHHEFESPEITSLLGRKEALSGNYTSVTLGEPVSAYGVLETHSFRHQQNLQSAEFVFQYGPADWLQAYGINILPSSNANEGAIDTNERDQN